jgi:inorganic pyrophosphatase
MLTAFNEAGALNVVVESPRGSSIKYKYDLQHGLVVMSRPLPSGFTYPFDWGFVAGTHAEDGDPVDALVCWDGSSYPGVVVPSRAIGALQIDQINRPSGKRVRNDRLLVVPVTAPLWADLRSVFDVSERARQEIEHFFTAAVAFEGKDLRVLGWADADEADALVRRSVLSR